MRSFTDKTDNRRAVYLNLASSIESQLRSAYERQNEEGLTTRADIARKLDVHRSVITRRLTGGQNMTVESIADMVWALGQCIKVDIFDPALHLTNEVLVVPNHSNTPESTSSKPIASRQDDTPQTYTTNSTPRIRLRLSLIHISEPTRPY